jgi:hypothetical protein
MQNHLYGISGQEEYLAMLDMIKKSATPKDDDDDGCNIDEDPMEKFNEDSYLEECAYSTYGEI